MSNDVNKPMQESSGSDQEIPGTSVPYSSAVLTLGILSVLGGCCLAGVPGLIMSAIALFLYKSGIDQYNASPQQYIEKSVKNLRIGRIFALVGLVLSILMLIAYIFVLQTGHLEELLKEFEEMNL